MKNYMSPEIEVLNVAKDVIATSGYGAIEPWDDFINNGSDMPM